MKDEDIAHFCEDGSLNQRAIIKMEGTSIYLKLQRRYLQQEFDAEAPIDVQTDAVAGDSFAYVCTECYRPTENTTDRRRVIARQNFLRCYEPGFLDSDGRPVGLPALSFLGKLLIARVRLFSHVLKVVVDVGSSLSVTGHIIATSTNAADQSALYSHHLPQVPPNSPGTNAPILTVCFIGPFDRLQSILHANVGEPIPRRIQMFRDRYLNSTYEPIRMWLHYLRQQNRFYR